MGKQQAVEIVSYRSNLPPDHYRVQVSYRYDAEVCPGRYPGEGNHKKLFSDQFLDATRSHEGSTLDRTRFLVGYESIDESPGERIFHVAEVPTEFLDIGICEIWKGLDVHSYRRGYRFATAIELAAFEDAVPAHRNGHEIFALGTVKVGSDLRRYVPILGRHPLFLGMRLKECWAGTRLRVWHRLLLVRKTS